MDQPTQKKPYVAPSLEVHEHVDEVVWGQFITTTTGSIQS
jgi:hypothetical protein